MDKKKKGKGHSIAQMFLINNYSPAEVGLNLEMSYIVFFTTDLYSPRCPLSESAGWTLVTLEQFEKFKMASKMAAVSCNWP